MGLKSIHSGFKFGFRDNRSALTLLDPRIWAADNQIFLSLAQSQICLVRELHSTALQPLMELIYEIVVVL